MPASENARLLEVSSFTGSAFSEPLLQAGILCSVLAYMVHVDFWMAVTAFLLFLPQLIFVPFMQSAMNRRTRDRVRLIRQLSIGVVDGRERDHARDLSDDARIERIFELNMGFLRFKFTMNRLPDVAGASRATAWRRKQ